MAFLVFYFLYNLFFLLFLYINIFFDILWCRKIKFCRGGGIARGASIPRFFKFFYFINILSVIRLFLFLSSKEVVLYGFLFPWTLVGCGNSFRWVQDFYFLRFYFILICLVLFLSLFELCLCATSNFFLNYDTWTTISSL